MSILNYIRSIRRLAASNRRDKVGCTRLEENTPLFAIEYDEISTAVKRQGVILLGGKQSNAYRNRGLRGKFIVISTTNYTVNSE
ncbi:anti-repressor [Bacillus phage FI_KG-Lek]|nr:anti-repressor [Bacillus phage FI_KG-Lek]